MRQADLDPLCIIGFLAGKGKHGHQATDFDQEFTLEFPGKKKDDKEITGIAFGNEISKSKVVSASIDSYIKFEFIYTVGKNTTFDIKFKGRLNKESTEITDGTFLMLIGKGTFTAKRAVPLAGALFILWP